MYDNEDDEAYLEAREQERIAKANAQVALAGRKAPEELVAQRSQQLIGEWRARRPVVLDYAQQAGARS